jgi:hypothetical protein
VVAVLKKAVLGHLAPLIKTPPFVLPWILMGGLFPPLEILELTFDKTPLLAF